MLFGLETVSVRKRHEAEIEIAEMRMFSLGVLRMDRSTLEGQVRLAVLETMSERLD